MVFEIGFPTILQLLIRQLDVRKTMRIARQVLFVFLMERTFACEKKRRVFFYLC